MRSTTCGRAVRFAVVAMLTTAAVAIAVAATSAPDTAFRVRPVSASRSDRGAVVRGTTAFALDVYAQLRATPGNFVFSPMSLSTALAMTAEGAAGKTRAEILSALHVSLPGARRPRAFQSVLAQMTPADASGVEIDVANGLWSDRSFPLLPGFVSRLQRRFGARAATVDFDHPTQALQVINAWGSDATHGLLPEALPAGALSAKDLFVLADAVYFKGAWEHPFDTRSDDWFHTTDGLVAVPLMSEVETLPAAYFDDVQMVELPYVGDDYAMLVLVPRWTSTLDDLEAKLTSRNLAAWTAALATDWLDVRFPPFKFTSLLDLKPAVQALGVTTAFSDRADFSRMSKRGARIGAVFQNALVRVDEQGTVAAAITTVVGIGSGQAFGGEEQPRLFRVDRPFLFLIRHRPTGTILFLGRVEDPTK